MRELVDQAAHKPGLAVTIATLWQQGLWQEILEGTRLRKTLLGAFEKMGGDKATAVLAAFGLGGDRGMKTEDVRDFLDLGWPEMRTLTSGLFAGGVLRVENDILSVWPRQLRWALVRSVFFEGPAALPYRELLDRAPHRKSAIESLVAARRRGAAIPDRDLLELVRDTPPGRAWEDLAALGPELARWVLANYPRPIAEVAEGALLGDPDATITSLLESASLSTSRQSHLWSLSKWLRALDLSGEELMERRSRVTRAAKRYLQAGGEVEVGMEAVSLVLSPTLTRTSPDPGAGRTVVTFSGVIGPDWIPGLAQLWDEILPVIPSLDAEGWSHLSAALWDWVDPEYAYKNEAVPPEVKSAMQGFATKILNDLAPMARASPGLTAGIRDWARRLGIEVSLTPDTVFDCLYPTEVGVRRDHTAIAALGAEWAGREPGEVADQLLFYDREAAKIGRRWQRNGAEVCEEIAGRVENPETWSAVFFERGLDANLVSPFWVAAAGARRAGWEDQIERAFESGRQGHVWAAIELVLEQPEPSPRLLSLALSHASSALHIVLGLSLESSVPLPVMRELLQSPDWQVALAAAAGEWAGEPKGTVREEIQELWRAAMLRARTGESLGSVRDQSLQFLLKDILRSIRAGALEV
jgi:hypothetical protein